MAEGDLGLVTAVYSVEVVPTAVNVYEEAIIASYTENTNYTVSVENGTYTITSKVVETTPPTDDNTGSGTDQNNSNVEGNVTNGNTSSNETFENDLSDDVIVEEETNSEEANEELEVPEYGHDEGNTSWSLVNLIATVTTIITVVYLALTRKKENENDEEKVIQKRTKVSMFVSSVLSLLSVILFFMTQDVTKVMQLVDIWTILFIGMVIVQWAIVVVSKKKDDDQNGQTYSTTN